MPRCYLCKKGNLRNLQVSHSKHRTKKLRKPNLHSYKMVVNGKNKRVKLCTKCLRRAKFSVLAGFSAKGGPASGRSPRPFVSSGQASAD